MTILVSLFSFLRRVKPPEEKGENCFVWKGYLSSCSFCLRNCVYYYPLIVDVFCFPGLLLFPCLKERRPYLATLCDDVDEAQKWRRDILKDIGRKVMEIQNGEELRTERGIRFDPYFPSSSNRKRPFPSPTCFSCHGVDFCG